MSNRHHGPMHFLTTAGPAPCGSDGRQTHDPVYVTCKKCLEAIRLYKGQAWTKDDAPESAREGLQAAGDRSTRVAAGSRDGARQ